MKKLHFPALHLSLEVRGIWIINKWNETLPWQLWVTQTQDSKAAAGQQRNSASSSRLAHQSFFFFNSPKTVTWKCSALPPLPASPVPVLESKWSLCCHYLSGLQLRLLGNASHISFYCKDPFNISYILFIADTFTFVHSVLRKVRDILAVLFWAHFTTEKKKCSKGGWFRNKWGVPPGEEKQKPVVGGMGKYLVLNLTLLIPDFGRISKFFDPQFSSLLNENNSFLIVISLQLNQVTQVGTSRHTVHFSSSHLVVCNSLRPRGLQHTRLPCPSPTPRDCLNSCPLSRWCHPAISSSVIPFSSCL